MSLCRNSDRLRHPLVRHDVQHPAPDTHLRPLLSISSARHTVAEERLHPEHLRLAQGPLVIPRLLLPPLPADLPDAAEVLVAGEPGAGLIAMPTDLRIPPGRDH